MWGRKKRAAYRRYVLSSRELPFRVIRSFGMQMKPMELNVTEQVEGNALFLYDTGTPEPAKRKKEKPVDLKLLEYGYGVMDGRDLLRFALKRMREKFVVFHTRASSQPDAGRSSWKTH